MGLEIVSLHGWEYKSFKKATPTGMIEQPAWIKKHLAVHEIGDFDEEDEVFWFEYIVSHISTGLMLGEFGTKGAAFSFAEYAESFDQEWTHVKTDKLELSVPVLERIKEKRKYFMNY